jgi:hypothetical protein
LLIASRIAARSTTQGAGRTILDFLAGRRVLLPVGNRLHIVGRNREATVFEAEHVLQQDFQAERELRDIADFLGRLGEGIIGVVLAVYREG